MTTSSDEESFERDGHVVERRAERQEKREEDKRKKEKNSRSMSSSLLTLGGMNPGSEGAARTKVLDDSSRSYDNCAGYDNTDYPVVPPPPYARLSTGCSGGSTDGDGFSPRNHHHGVGTSPASKGHDSMVTSPASKVAGKGSKGGTASTTASQNESGATMSVGTNSKSHNNTGSQGHDKENNVKENVSSKAITHDSMGPMNPGPNSCHHPGTNTASCATENASLPAGLEKQSQSSRCLHTSLSTKPQTSTQYFAPRFTSFQRPREVVNPFTNELITLPRGFKPLTPLSWDDDYELVTRPGASGQMVTMRVRKNGDSPPVLGKSNMIALQMFWREQQAKQDGGDRVLTLSESEKPMGAVCPRSLSEKPRTDKESDENRMTHENADELDGSGILL